MRVGLTGGIASGKSTVTALLREAGVTVIDGDALAREVVAAGTPGLARLVEEFGPDLLTDGGELDRPAMGRLVFGDTPEARSARKRLEAIVHPLVHERITELEAAVAPGDLVVHDIPLLAERYQREGRAGDFDAVVVVDVPTEVQVERMVRDRGWSEDDARARIASQASREDRLAFASYVIDNSGTREDLRSRVAEVLAALRAGEQRE